jgi:CheY-like chemotaxis protein
MRRTRADKPAVILIVEDELLVRLLANDILEEAGFHTIEARDGQEALAVLELQPNIRLLFTDATMPNLDGFTLAKVVAERWPKVDILVTSALPPPPGALPAGAKFLAKPYDPEKLLAALAQFLGGAAVDLSEPESADAAPVLPMPEAMKRPGVPSGAGLAQPLAKPEK